MGAQILQNAKKMLSERVLEKSAPKVTHPKPLGTPSDPESDARVQAGAPFSLFHLSRKCGPKVVPLAPFWHPFGRLNGSKLHKVPFLK